jgi:hypothetical protein
MALPLDTLLGTAHNFDVLAGSTVTNSGATVLVGGDLGLYPGTSVTGFPPGVVTPPNTQHVTDATAQQAQIDLVAAFTYFYGLTGGTTIVGNLNGQTFTTGLYNSATSIDLAVNGTVTLDAQGDTEAQFIFQAGSTITFNVGSTVKLINGAQSTNVLFVSNSSITVGTSAVVEGNLLALSSVSLGTGATLNGRALARNAAVTLLGNTIVAPVDIVPPLPPVPPVGLSSYPSAIVLTEICFPDITGKSIRAWGEVFITPGGYTTGGIPMGLWNFADIREVDFNGILSCEVYGEAPVTNLVGISTTYRYSPSTDKLQIFNNGIELANNSVITIAVLADTLLFEAQWDRTSTRG